MPAVQAYEQIHPFLPAMGGIAAFAALAGLRGASLRAQAPAAAKLSLCFFGKVFAQKPPGAGREPACRNGRIQKGMEKFHAFFFLSRETIGSAGRGAPQRSFSMKRATNSKLSGMKDHH